MEVGDGLVMESVYIDDFQIHTNTGDIGYWIQAPIDGLDSPEYRTTTYDRPGEHGANLTSLLYGGRLITLRGVIKGASPAQHETRRYDFSTALAISHDTYARPIAKVLKFTTVGGSTYRTNVYMRTAPRFDYDDIMHTRFLINLIATDPVIYTETQSTSGAILRPSGGGFVLPVTFPITSTAAVGGRATLNNAGNVPVYPEYIELTGPLTNPFIANASDDNRYIQLNYTIGSGDVVTIYPADHAIVLNGSSNLLSSRVAGSSWWKLQEGNNSIIFSTGSTSDTGTMELVYRSGRLAV